MPLTLKAIRINKGLSQEEAARALGISRDTLSNWERGETYPNIPQLKNIEKVYEVSYDSINFLL